MILIHEDERFDLDDLSAKEAVVIEEKLGFDWDEVEVLLKGQKPGAMTLALAVLRKRTDSSVDVDDFDVPGWRNKLKVRLTSDEVKAHHAEILRQFKEAGPERDRMLHLLKQIADRPDDVDELEKGKAPKGGRARGA
jgi:hypothetical protein